MLRTIAFVLAMIVGIGAAASSRFGGLLFYLWFALFRPQEWVWIDVEAFRLSLVAGSLFVVPCLLTGVWPNLTHPLSIGSLLFLATGFVAQLNAVDPATGWFWLTFMSRQIVVSLLLITVINTPRRFTIAIAVMSCSLAFHATKFGVGYLLRGGAQFNTDIGGAFGSTNEFALAAGRLMFLLIAAAQNIGIPWARLGMLTAVPFTMLGIISTFSRGGFLGVACAGLLLIVLQRRRAVALAAICVAVVLGYWFVPVPDTYINRINTIGTYEEVGDRSALGRLHYWRVAVLMVEAEPLGVGLRNFEKNYNRFDFLSGEFGTDRSVHSSYFQALAETGYIGGAVFAWLMAYAFWITLRVRKRSRMLSQNDSRFFFTSANALLASLTVFAIGGAFAAEMMNELNWFTFGLVAVLDRLSRSAVAAMDLGPDIAQPHPTNQAEWRPEIAARTGTSIAATGAVPSGHRTDWTRLQRK
jgi:probable O-glycosylation ligase (exosortase A-associated)